MTVGFGPSRSKRFRKAVEEARGGAGECSELGPGSYRVRFVLGRDGRVYTSLARLLQRVRNWRATEGVRGRPARLLLPRPRDGLVCLFAACLVWRVPLPLLLRRLAALFSLPLFDVERAVRDVLGENTPNMIEIRLPPRIEALLAGEPPPPIIAPPVDPNWQIPDHPPDEWWQDLGDAEPSD